MVQQPQLKVGSAPWTAPRVRQWRFCLVAPPPPPPLPLASLTYLISSSSSFHHYYHIIMQFVLFLCEDDMLPLPGFFPGSPASDFISEMCTLCACRFSTNCRPVLVSSPAFSLGQLDPVPASPGPREQMNH